MLITADEARKRIPVIEEWPVLTGENVVSDHDEDYVVDALFDIPNR